MATAAITAVITTVMAITTAIITTIAATTIRITDTTTDTGITGIPEYRAAVVRTLSNHKTAAARVAVSCEKDHRLAVARFARSVLAGTLAVVLGTGLPGASTAAPDFNGLHQPRAR